MATSPSLNHSKPARVSMIPLPWFLALPCCIQINSPYLSQSGIVNTCRSFGMKSWIIDVSNWPVLKIETLLWPVHFSYHLDFLVYSWLERNRCQPTSCLFFSYIRKISASHYISPCFIIIYFISILCSPLLHPWSSKEN